MDRRLNGLNPLAYMGVDPYTPPELVIHNRPPTQNDLLNYYLGTIWIDNGTNNPPTNEDIWMLVDIQGNIATWVNFGGGDLETLTGNIGGPVPGDANDNINIIGINGITVTGNPGTNTLTITTTGGGPVLQTLTGDVGGPVQPDVNGNINTLGTAGHITTTGNPGTNTITWDLDDSIADQYTTDAGIAVPVANNLNVFGGTAGRDINTTGAGDTIHVELNNAITLGDLAALGADIGAMTAVTGDVIITAGDLTLPNTNAAGNQGIIKFGGNRWISNYGTDNTFVGQTAGNTTLTVVSAQGNTVIGSRALTAITTGNGNTAVGVLALAAATTGAVNIAIGGGVLSSLTTGTLNVVIGGGPNITTATQNTLVGVLSGAALTTGSNNTCIGQSSGGSLNGADSHNLLVGSVGVGGDTQVMRLGDTFGPSPHTKCFVAGVRGVTTGVADAIAVLVDSANQFGTISSSIRYKENIEDMGSSSDDVMKLRPVTFNYKKDEAKRLQFGLIAEEVEEVFPRLVVYDKDGIPDSVKYHEIPSILLNEIQKLEARVEKLEKLLATKLVMNP